MAEKPSGECRDISKADAADMQLTLLPFAERHLEKSERGPALLGLIPPDLIDKDRKILAERVRNALKKIGIDPLFFNQMIEEPDTGARPGFPNFGITVVHDQVRRRWERRDIGRYVSSDGNPVPDRAIGILETFQRVRLPIGSRLEVWTPDRRSHETGELPDPMLVLVLGPGICFGLCRWNG